MFIGVLSTMERLEIYNKLYADDNLITFNHYDISFYKNFSDFIKITKSVFGIEALIVDISDYEFTKDDLQKGLLLYSEFFSSSIIFVVKNIWEYQGFFNNLEFYNVISCDDKNFSANLQKTLEGKGKNIIDSISSLQNSNIEKALNMTNFMIDAPASLDINIGVVGATPRCGTTTIAISLVSYLNKTNLNAIFIDKNGILIDVFKNLGEYEAQDDCILVNNIPFSQSSQPKNYNIKIWDMGNHIQAFSDNYFDIKLICSCSKLWELPNAAEAFSKSENVNMIFNLPGDEDKENVLKIWKDNAFFFPFVSNIWDIKEINDVLFIKYLIEKLFENE